MTAVADLTLKPGRDKPVRHRHPWIFSGAIAGLRGQAEPGDMVQVRAANGEPLAVGYYNPHSQIVVRLLAWDPAATIDDAWWGRMIAESVARRSALARSDDTNAYRLVYAEADGLPGLIVDRYDDILVCQFLTAGIERARPVIVEALAALLRPRAILDQSDNEIRQVEGLPPASGALRGEAPSESIAIRENGFSYRVDFRSGQKTGFYLDQRTNRARVARHASGRAILDCFCYTGGFTVPALAAGAAAATCVDSSAPALQMLTANVSALGEKAHSVETICGNVFEVLRKFRDQARQFDLIVLDPPKLAAAQTQVTKALRAYKDLNLLALKLLTPGGILASFSCSGTVTRAAFQEAVAWASTDAGRSVRILEQLGQGEDHPLLISFPESEYLKGLIARVD
ncbi:MAG TPA: class I SAM-dependent rRNA methyltransferase [bacterium]|nr:class I SAM-dependent rRNA methyltransferase [bacterium]